MSTETGIRPYGAGKYNTMLDSIIYETLGDSFDAETGSVDELGWFGRMNGLDDVPRVGLTLDEIELLDGSCGAIVREDSQGFVTFEYYTHEEEMELVWEGIEQDYAGLNDDSEEKEQDEDDDEEAEPELG